LHPPAVERRRRCWRMSTSAPMRGGEARRRTRLKGRGRSVEVSAPAVRTDPLAERRKMTKHATARVCSVVTRRERAIAVFAAVVHTGQRGRGGGSLVCEHVIVGY
jgi:hypothetical protein